MSVLSQAMQYAYEVTDKGSYAQAKERIEAMRPSREVEKTNPSRYSEEIATGFAHDLAFKIFDWERKSIVTDTDSFAPRATAQGIQSWGKKFFDGWEVVDGWARKEFKEGEDEKAAYVMSVMSGARLGTHPLNINNAQQETSAVNMRGNIVVVKDVVFSDVRARELESLSRGRTPT